MSPRRGLRPLDDAREQLRVESHTDQRRPRAAVERQSTATEEDSTSTQVSPAARTT